MRITTPAYLGIMACLAIASPSVPAQEPAAATHDADLVGHYYARLLENCVRCHSAFARQRFPGLAVPAGGGRH